MQVDFWHERWEKQQIGFHEGRPNPLLLDHHDCLDLAAGERVFVPLCGKSVDLRWLRDQGWLILGCELSPIAVGHFFEEQGLLPQVTRAGSFARWTAENITLLCGDFFALNTDDLAGCSAVYDRAALIALPQALRESYVAQMRRLLPSGAKSLLITLEYPQQEMDGPPFSVGDGDVVSLFSAHAEVRHLAAYDRLDSEPRFKERGLTRLMEHAFCLDWR